MRKLIAGVTNAVVAIAGAVALTATSVSTAAAQTESMQPDAPASAPESAFKAPVYGVMNEDAPSAGTVTDFCSLDPLKKLPAAAMVVVVRKTRCNSRYGAALSKDFMEVLYSGARFLVPVGSVDLTDEASKALAAIDVGDVHVNFDRWLAESARIMQAQVEKARKTVDQTARFGIALVRSGPYDVSEHTEGTGYAVTVYNSTKKVIKYVTFTVVGLNAVGDPVKGPLSTGITKTLRGIGPIELGRLARTPKTTCG